MTNGNDISLLSGRRGATMKNFLCMKKFLSSATKIFKQLLNEYIIIADRLSGLYI